jgi:hypothetical protein
MIECFQPYADSLFSHFRFLARFSFLRSWRAAPERSHIYHGTAAFTSPRLARSARAELYIRLLRERFSRVAVIPTSLLRLWRNRNVSIAFAAPR